mmetsp:Transcript_71888/g.150207  ORF Transcript_71888/g.150207 Transcript_71888/m.150207 type:complete len:194 (+) Transcript_71888:287-868(+)|eukprot:CAMPEP_0181345122 /NCGR_PEP_ID=MMETSP1101-20121128/32577_1 /TAXON_ID=46948 /ORGANISM="Rhodomonas abbreviata, Strain Caron Lab Isolate" /LENGTH=193 /DNA_ID=CAMNT_0023457049 /DNA_START=356 /DNA_END=937 /DNA_ORIENTATION=-
MHKEFALVMTCDESSATPNALGRKGIELLRKYGIISQGPLEEEDWTVSNAKLESLTESKTFATVSCQADTDPFENDLFIHYVPTDAKKANGLAGMPNPSGGVVKGQQSRVFISSFPDPVATPDVRKEPQAGYSALPILPSGPSMSVHRLSYQGAEFLDAALNPGAWYTNALTHPGTMASLQRPRYWNKERMDT